jgi:co-chaperonin GroES (HSP10)
MKAIGDRILVEVNIEVKKTVIKLATDEGKKATITFTVKQIGEGVPKDWPVKEGDRVILGNYDRLDGQVDIKPISKEGDRTFQGIIEYQAVKGTWGPDEVIPLVPYVDTSRQN